MAPPPPRPPPPLIDDLVGEILLRLPPDDPACLVRASLVCKPWRRLLSYPAFLRRYRAFHGAPPVLGFLPNRYRTGGLIPRFVPITAPSPMSSSPSLGDVYWWALDCRHGRALLLSFEPSFSLIVWDPITGDQKHLPLPVHPCDDFTAAVLCAADGCDHLDCRGGPFVVVFKGTDDDGVTWASVYSSQTGAWSVPASIHIGPILDSYDVMERSVLAGDALYFTLEDGKRILKYDLRGHVLSVINLPPLHQGNMVLVTAEDRGLGIASVKGYSLHLWWRAGPDGAAEWVQGRVIELDMMLSISIGDPSSRLRMVGFVESAGTIFVSANAGIFSVESKSGRVRKVCERGDFVSIFPYVSFYTPDHASARLQAPMRTEGLIQ